MLLSASFCSRRALLGLTPAELKAYPFSYGKSRSTGYEYHSFAGTLIPRIVAEHGGLDALEARVRKKRERSEKIRATKQRRASMTAEDMLAQAAEADAKRAKTADARRDALAARLSSLQHGLIAKQLPFDSAEDARAFCAEVGLLDELAPFFAEMATSKVGVKRVLAALAERAPIAAAARELHTGGAAHGDAAPARYPDARAAQTYRALRQLVARVATSSARAHGAGGEPVAPDGEAAVLRAAAESELRRLQRIGSLARQLGSDEAARAQFAHVPAMRSVKLLGALVERVAASMPASSGGEDDDAALRAAVCSELTTLEADFQQRKATGVCAGGHRCVNKPAGECAHVMCGRCCPGCSRHPR